MKVQEEPNSTTKIVKSIIQTEKPTTETSYYEKRVIKTTTTITTTRGCEPSTQNINTRYSNINNINNNTNNNVIKNRNTPEIITTTYTRPNPVSRGRDKNINIIRNYDAGRSQTSNQQNNRYANSNYQNKSSWNSRGNSQIQTKNISTQNYTGNKYQPKITDN